MPALDDFLIRIFPVEKQVVGCDIPHIRITDVYVHPDYRRQGIGARLTKVPLEEADKLGLPVYIEATAEGGKLYLSLGFEIKKELSHDLAPYGVDAEPYVNYTMWRETRRVEA